MIDYKVVTLFYIFRNNFTISRRRHNQKIITIQQSSHIRHLLELHIGLLCISTSGALGRYVELPPPLTIWWRALFALFFLGVYCYYRKFSFRFDFRKKGGIILGTGVLMMLHWVLYFYALQWSNVAVGMLSLMTFPAMTALLEPLILKTPFQKIQLLLAGLVLLGIYFLVPNFDMENSITLGLIMGLLSAFCYSIRNILLKTQVDSVHGSVIMFYQILITLGCLIPVFGIYETEGVVTYLPFLILLGLVTTAIGHTLFLNSFKHFSVSTASLVGSIQPIYGVLIAILFLGEYPTWQSVIGGILILSTVIIESMRSSD